MNNVDKEYFRLIELVLSKGRLKKNRTGVDTLGVFGAQARFDLSEGFPLLTTKRVFFKGVVHELLWFLSGSTNIKYLVDNDVHIWDHNAYDNYEKRCLAIAQGLQADCTKYYDKDSYISLIKKDPDFAKQWGELGEGTYGGMWRKFPYLNRNDIDYDYVPDTGVDQIENVINKLKSNPDDRRLIVSAWHPYWVDHCALPPCHALFQFHTEELSYDERYKLFDEQRPNFSGHEFYPEILDEFNIPKRKLNCQLYQRSCDLFLGVPFNIASYALLLSMIAHCVDMLPGEFIHTYGDLHLYTNHIDQAKEQLQREPRKLPDIYLKAIQKDLFQIRYEDIILRDYNPHPAIKAAMAV